MLWGRRSVQAFSEAAICTSRMAAGNGQRFQPARLDRAGAGRRADAPASSRSTSVIAYGVNAGPLGTPKLDLPPFRGPIHRPVCPDDEGHFDGFQWRRPNSPRRMSSARSGSCSTSGSAISAGASTGISRATIASSRSSSCRSIDNAYAGYGFMEVGAHPRPDGASRPYALNFDVMAHELGHLIIYSTIGVPSPSHERGEYYGFQESAADTTALIAAMHFESLLKRIARGDARQSLRLQRARPFRGIVAARTRFVSPATTSNCRSSPPAGRTSIRCRSR